jgi:glycerol-3-phosphate cytidylyltransferase
MIQIDKNMTGYTNGVYDLFHIGHVNLLKRIKENCNKLIVGVHNDEQVISYKKRKPIISYNDRLEMIRSCKYVDEIYENADLLTTDELLAKLKADYMFVGKENEEFLKYFYPVSDGKLILLERTAGISTSDIIEKIINNYDI